MKLIFTICLLVLFLSCSCSPRIPADQNPGNSSNAVSEANSSNVDRQNSEWPYPAWNNDPTVTIENGTDTVFKADKLTDLALKIPTDWEKIINRPSLLLYKSPTVNSLFANLMLQSGDTKPVPGIPVDPKKNFDYSTYEPDAALEDYLAKKTQDAASGRMQQLAIDGVLGVLEQTVYKDSGSSNSAAKPPYGLWHWTTFMKNKTVNNKVDVSMVYPLSEIEKFTSQIAGLVNSIRIKRTEGVLMIEVQ